MIEIITSTEIITPLSLALINLLLGLNVEKLNKITLVSRLNTKADQIRRGTITLNKVKYKIIDLSNYKDLGDKIVIEKQLQPMVENRINNLERTLFIASLLYSTVTLLNVFLISADNAELSAFKVSFGAIGIFIVYLIILAIILLEQRSIIKQNKLLKK